MAAWRFVSHVTMKRVTEGAKDKKREGSGLKME